MSETATAPHLYWAIAALPQPLVSMTHSFAYERELAFEQFKQFREVDETPQPAIYWQRFAAKLAEESHDWSDLGSGMLLGFGAPAAQALSVGALA